MDKKTLLPFLTFASLGLILGLGGFTVFHAKGFSYFKDEPEACVN